MDKDGVSAINSYNVAKKYSVLSANQRALSHSKVNKLQEWLKDFKTRRTKITRSNYANIDLSRPVCSTPLKPVSKHKVQEKIIDFTPMITKENIKSVSLQTPLHSNNYIENEQIVAETKLSLSAKPDLAQLKKPLFNPTTQQTNSVTSSQITIAPIPIAFSSGSKPLTTNAPIWNPIENSSTPKSAVLNEMSNKFKVFTKEPLVFNSTNTAPLFGNNVNSTDASSKDPVDFSVKSSTAKPLSFSNTNNIISTKSTLDIISGTTALKEKTPFNFSNMPTVKTEATIPKSSFNFSESIKNKIDNPKDTPINTFSFAPLSKPTETTKDKSVNYQDTIPTKDETLSTFNFNSKLDTPSLSSFNFKGSEADGSKSTASETKNILTSTSPTAVTASFNFALPAKIIPVTASEPTGSAIPSSTYGVFKTPPVPNAVPLISTSDSVTDTTHQVSESPTPIISEPVTPESENLPTVPNNTNNAPIFEIPSTSTSFFGTSNNSTITASAIENSTSTSSQTSIFSTQTNTNSAASIFSTPPKSTNASTIFSTSTSTTSTSSIFGTTASTTSTPSIFGTPTNTTKTTASSIFGTPTNTTTASSIFGASVSTASSSIFGNPIKTTSSIFGTPATTVNSLFESAATTNTSGFGSPIQTATVFGSPSTTSSSIFGNPTSSASSCNSIFGSASTTTSSIFGAPVATITTSSIFGSPSTTAASSGLFGSVAAAANQPSSFGQPSLGFSSPGSAFGNMSLFGQQACSPSQPSSSFAPAVNPFAVNKTSSSPSLFTSQKSLFGQPTAR